MPVDMSGRKSVGACTCCGAPSLHTIQIARGPDHDGKSRRLYLPNLFARENGADIEEMPFCPECLRTIEDNFRATVQYLKTEHDGRKRIANKSA